MKHGYGIFEKVPVPGTFEVRVRVGYVWVRLGTYPLIFFLKKKNWVRLGCGSGTAGCGWVRLWVRGLIKLCRFGFFFFCFPFFLFLSRFPSSEPHPLVSFIQNTSKFPFLTHQPPPLNWSTGGGAPHSIAMPAARKTQQRWRRRTREANGNMKTV